MYPEVKALIDHYNFDALPLEGTLFTSTWRSEMERPDGGPVGTAIIGMYCEEPRSVSFFHKLKWDEIWHFYAGDPYKLILLHEDGSSQDVIMGPDPLAGQNLQFRIPAHVWQAGHLIEGGRYALWGNTMAPGFTGAIWEGETADKLIARWPDRADDIKDLCVEGPELTWPEGYAP